jgi:hypothetical protein
MMKLKFLLPILINVSIHCLVASSTISLRGANAINDTQEELHNSQQLLEDVTCKLFFEEIDFGNTADYPEGYSEEKWLCELAKKDAEKLNGLQYVDIVGSDDILSDARSGISTLSVTQALFNLDELTMRIPNNAIYELNHNGKKKKKKKPNGAVAVTTLQTLVVRVQNGNGVGPDATVAQLKESVFDDAVSLKTQYDACSYGKLKIQPFVGRTDTGIWINNGVVSIKADYTGSDRGHMQQKVFEKAKERLGDLDNEKYDLIMFCFPPGTGDWLAYAFVDSKYSFYNNEWCGYVSTQMHEVGHNLGLAHSGEVDEGNYADQTGFMGFSYPIDDQRMCFNAAKSYQLDWYYDQVKSINPLNKRGSATRTYKLNGVSDYGRDKSSMIVLRLEQTLNGSPKDYYIGFNRRDGINKDTVEDQDVVTVVRKESGGPHEYGQSMQVAELEIGFSYVIPNFNNDRDVEIRYIAGGYENKFAYVQIVDVERQKAKDANASPPSCKPFTVEVMTDGYPGESYFTFREEASLGWVYARSMEYKEMNKLYTQEICLPYDKSYRFDFTDLYGDGICCSQGQGYYRVKNDQGVVMFSGAENFSLETHYFSVGPDPNPPSDHEDHDDPACKDNKGRHKWQLPGKEKKKGRCRLIKRLRLCNKDGTDGAPLWQKCKKSCNRC